MVMKAANLATAGVIVNGDSLNQVEHSRNGNGSVRGTWAYGEFAFYSIFMCKHLLWFQSFEGVFG